MPQTTPPGPGPTPPTSTPTTSPPPKLIGDVFEFRAPPSLQELKGGYAFTKQREVAIDWEDILGAVGDDWRTLYQERNPILEFMRESVAPGPFTLEELTRLGRVMPATVGSAVRRGRQRPGSMRFYAELPATEAATVKDRIIPTSDLNPVPLNSLLVGVETAGGLKRWYLPLSGEPENYRPILASDDWDKAWESVTALELVDLDAQDQLSTIFPFTEVVRSEAAIIMSKFNAFAAELDFALAQEAIAKTILEKFAKAESAEPDEVARVGEQYRRLKTDARKARAQIAQLKATASSLGLVLATEDKQTFAGRDSSGKPQAWPLVKGELYRVRPKTVSWTTRHKKKGGRDLFGRRKTKYSTESHSATHQHYHREEIDVAPWTPVLARYSQLGMEVHQFDFAPDGRLVSDGITLADLADVLEKNETRRRNILIALPIRERSILGDDFLAGYLLIGRPEPQIRRLDPPSLQVRHRLAYRYAWTGTALGELVTTIPLSPGEEREVEIRSSTTFEEKILQTSSSLIELSRIDKTDFESVFEREVTKETERTTKMSATASGSYSGASGSASFSSENRVKDVARTLNRAVQKASSETSNKEQYTVKNERSESSVSTSSNLLTYKVRNINEAVTLNVCFYRLNNTYDSGVVLLGSDVMLEVGRSLLPEADIHDHSNYPFNDVRGLFDHISRPGNFPIDLSPLRSNETARNLIITKLIRAITVDLVVSIGDEDLSREFEASSPPELKALMTGDPAGRSRGEQAADALVDKARALHTGPAAAPAAASNLLNLSSRFMEIVEKAIEKGRILVPDNFLLDSGGLYADLVVGKRTGTDQYSNDRRELEKKKVEAEIDLKVARAEWYRARAEAETPATRTGRGKG